MVDEFTEPTYRRQGVTRRLAAGMRPTLERLGIREVVGIHRTDNHDTIAAARKKGIPRVGMIVRYRLLWHVSFDYVEALEGSATRITRSGRGSSASGGSDQARGASPTATTTSDPRAVVGWTPRP
jgi:hypothetical protein